MTRVHLRADPSVFRVAIRRIDDRWRVIIGPRCHPGTGVERTHRSPTRALVLAMRAAEGWDMTDASASTAYDHPQHPEPRSS